MEIYKVALAIISNKKILLLREAKSKTFILPGGRFEANENDEMALKREIMEELNCEIAFEELVFLGKFRDKAANEPNSFININLYIGSVIGEIKLDNEIEEMVWYNPLDTTEIKIADSIKNKILPVLVEKELL